MAASKLPLRFWNSLSSSFEGFESQDESKAIAEGRSPKVRMYVCGPTVYDAAHLGHARCYITWDLLFRVLQFAGYDVTYVRNVTDVDDKILKRAGESGETPSQLAERNYISFRDDMNALNVLPPTVEPRATAHIDDMQTGILTLIKQGAAYATKDGSSYFRVSAKADYGKLKFATQDPEALKAHLDDLKAGARVEAEEGKESPLDFALWKSVPDDDPHAWEFPTASDFPKGEKPPKRGRPGWHLECSAMNHAIFKGEALDIHAGGADLIFPHHENEIAQSEAWMGHGPFSRFWLHNGFVNVSGEKMSKSLGNFSTIKSLLSQYDASTIRYFLLTNGYRMPVDFNDEALQSAKNWVNTRIKLLRQSFDAIKKADASITLESLTIPNRAAFLQTLKALEWQNTSAEASEAVNCFHNVQVALADDLNTAQALANLNKAMNALKAADESSKAIAFRCVLAMWQLLGFDASVLAEQSAEQVDLSGIPAADLAAFASEIGLTDADASAPVAILEGILRLRRDVKAAKNWAQADAIRNRLTEWGFKILDSKDGTSVLEKDGVSVVSI